MDLPAVQLLCLEQRDRSLEDHTRDFLNLACLTHFPDRSLCVFYISSLSERCKARLPANGPKEDFAAFMEWVLENNGSPLTVCPSEEDISSPTHVPETSQLSSRCTESLPEATATEPIIATELEPQASSDQVREQATLSVPEGVLVVIEGLEGSPAHSPATEGELQLVFGNHIEELMDIFEMDLIDWFGEVLPSAPKSPVSPLVPSSPESPVSSLVPSSPESPASPLVPPSSSPPVFPPSLPLPPPLEPVSSSAQASLVPVSSSAHPQSASTGRSDPSPLDFQPPALPRREDSLSPPPASEPWTPSRSFEPSAPPWLIAPSSPPWPIIPPAPPASLVPPAPPWSVVDHPPPWDSAPLASPRHSIPPALSGSSFPSAPPSSSVAPAPPRSSGSLPPPQSPEPSAPPRPSGSSTSPWLSVCSVPPGSPPPAAQSPPVGPLVFSVPSPPWLLPPSTPPWATILAGLWIATWLLLLWAPPWLLPPSTPSRLPPVSRMYKQ